MIYFVAIILFLLGIYCIVIKKNLIKIIIGLVIIEYAINLLSVSIGYKSGGHAPIIEEGAKWTYVDPLPQALVLTAIVIGLATTILIVAIAMRLYQRYETLDIREIRKLRG